MIYTKIKEDVEIKKYIRAFKNEHNFSKYLIQKYRTRIFDNMIN
jgi:hypothetical protein